MTMTDEDLARDRAACNPGGNEYFVGDASRRWPVALDEIAALRSDLAASQREVERLRGLLNAPTEDDRPYVCPGCHAVAPERCVPGCIDAEIEAELSEREYEPTESEDDEP